MKDFSGKLAVITGAGSGIGRAVALLLAEKGCHLAICDKDQDTLAETVQLTQKHNTTVISAVTDVTDRQAVLAFADKVKVEIGQVDILVNNAGVGLAVKHFEEVSVEEWEWILNINLWGIIYTTQAFLPLIPRHQGAAIVNLSSMLGLVGMINQTPYSTTKFAIRGFSESLRMEMLKQGIHVTTVHPGAVDTNIIDNTWADEENKKLVKSYVEKIGPVPVDKAAHEIVKAVANQKGRVVIGKDAKQVDWLARILPGSYAGMILKQMKKKLGA